MNDSVFRQRVSSVMTDNMYERKVKGRTRGSLDMRSLHKVASGSKNVFTQKMAKKGKQYNVVMIIDESGSMGKPGWGDYKIDKAVQACTYLVKTFEGLNINTAIVGYNGQITHHKDFGQTIDLRALEKDVEDRANHEGNYQNHEGRLAISCNHDFDGIAEAYKMLYNRKGTNLVIALSDGKANCDMGCQQTPQYDQDKHRTARIHALIHENERIAKTIGIGVLYECEQFPTRIVINNLNDLKTEMAQVLKKEIKRG